MEQNNNKESIKQALSLFEDQVNSRYKGAFWFEKAKDANIVIVGVGGIGSNLAWQLHKTSPMRMELIDPDEVEPHNLSGQFYSLQDIGHSKVSRTLDKLQDYDCNTYIVVTPARFENSHIYTRNTAIFLGLDNMEARKEVFEVFKNTSFINPVIFIDGRCSADEFHVYAVPSNDPDKIRRYEEELFTDDEADATICSFKQTAYIASMTASTMVHLYVNWLINESEGFAVMPFKIEFNSFTSDYKTIM